MFLILLALHYIYFTFVFKHFSSKNTLIASKQLFLSHGEMAFSCSPVKICFSSTIGDDLLKLEDVRFSIESKFLFYLKSVTCDKLRFALIFSRRPLGKEGDCLESKVPWDTSCHWAHKGYPALYISLCFCFFQHNHLIS